ncbi:non-ribosomal peptide synthetase [Candidatus Tisiphia endosymbiont of Temnostethus pusillus]|uniref:non-ribosomal peptide synthetase n=1 Tax=Candidatus Tisiphia endosymbiont of Temnostethus pusillus TaxID=3139335 RepID=UPI0035C88E9A
MTIPNQLPLSASQKRLWWEWKNNLDNLSYNINFCYRFKGKIDVPKLLDAILITLNKTGVLTLRFSENEGTPYQYLLDQFADRLDTTFVDLSLQPEEHGISAAIKEYLTPFDLLNQSAYRQLLLKLDIDEYLLCMTFHHIILDNIGGNMLIDCIEDLYLSNLSNENNIKPLYKKDVLSWSQKEQLGESHIKTLEDYWSTRLHNAQTSTKFLERSVSIKKFRGRRRYFTLSNRLSRELLSLVKSTNSTLFIVITAFVNCLIYRFTHQEQVSVSYSVNNRQAQDSQSIGFHIDMLILLCNISSDASFVDLVDHIKHLRKADRQYQYFSTPYVLKILRTQKQTLPNVVVNQSLSFVRTFKIPEVECTNFHINEIDPQCDLLISFEVRDNQIHFEFEYNLEKYNPEFIANLQESFITLMSDIVIDPSKLIADYSLVNNNQQQRLLGLSRGNDVYVKPCKNIYQYILDQVSQVPNNIALVYCDTSITYKDLDVLVNKFVSLINSVAGNSKSVGICLERSINQVISILAVVKSGRAYIPLDADYPEERLVYILEHSMSEVILSDSENLKKFINFKNKKIDISSREFSNYSNKVSKKIPTGENIYIIYTSGSTGNPKGIPIKHNALLNRIDWMQNKYQLTQNDRVLHKTPYSFDVSVWEIFWPLMYGSTIIIAPPGIHRDPISLSKYIVDHKVNIMHFVPSMLNAFLQFKEVRQAQSLTRVFASGEAINYAIIEDFKQKFPHTKLSNLYGPTEASIDATYWDCEENTESLTPPIGKPIQNTQCFILDSNFKLLPIGVSGDLYISGICLTSGYLNALELSKISFLQNIYSDNLANYQIMYKTADKARFLCDGNIEYLGRADDQIKIRGIRIELGEINNNIAKFPYVSNSCTILVNSKLVAFIEVAEHNINKFNLEKLQKRLAIYLPEFMIPSHYNVITELPLTPSGKIDKKRLIKNFEENNSCDNIQNAVIKPTNYLITKVANIWAEILEVKVEEITENSNFFTLGGDSLQMLHMLAKIQSLNINVKPPKFLSNPVLSYLTEDTTLVDYIDTRDTLSLSYKLTPIQHWFFDKINEDYNIFFQHCTFIVDNIDGITEINRAVTTLLANHEIFNTIFRRQHSIWIWIKKESAKMPNYTFDNLIEGQKLTKDLVLKQLATKIDIETGIFFAVCLWCDAKDQKVKITFACHHLIIDIVSWNLFFDELNLIYKGQSSINFAPNRGYLHWSNSINNYARNIEVEETEIEFFHSQLLASSTTSFSANALADSYSLSFPVQNTKSSIDYGITVLTSAISALSQTLNIDSILVEHESHGRYDLTNQSVNLASTIGWFTAKYPINYRNIKDSPLEFIYHNCSNSLKTVQKNEVNFGILKYLSNHQISKLFQEYKPLISFNFLGQTRLKNSYGVLLNDMDGQIGLYKSKKIKPLYLIDLNCWVEGNRVECSFDITLSRAKAKEFLEIFTRNFNYIQSSGELPNYYIATPFQKDILTYNNSIDNNYISAWQLTIANSINENALKTACLRSVERHKTIRSKLVYDEIDTKNVLLKVQAPTDSIYIAYNSSEIANNYNNIDDLIDAEKINGFDIKNGKVIRFVLIKRANQTYDLIILVHHAVIDGQSMHILKKDIVNNYNAILANKNINDKLHTDFSDYANWINTRSAHKSYNYWRNILKDFEPTRFIYKLSDKENKTDFSYLIRSYSISNKIFSFLQQNSLTFSTVLNALVGILISCHMLESSKVIWGNTLSIRPHNIKGVENIVGPCVATVPLCFDFDKDLNLIEFCKQVAVMVAEAVEYGNVALSTISNLIDKGELFNFLFACQNYEKQKEDESSLITIEKFSGKISAHFDCTFICELVDNELHINAKFNNNCFDAEALTAFSDKLHYLLENIETLASKPVTQINIIDKWEQDILSYFTNTDIPYDIHTSLWSLVKQHIEKDGNKIAIYDHDGKNYSYSYLAIAVSKISSRLSNLRKIRYIGIFLPRSFMQVAAVISVFRTNFCLIGLETTFPKYKLKEICNYLGLKYVITSTSYVNLIQDLGINVINVDEIGDDEVLYETIDAYDPEQERIISYTSGSTGNPKLVVSTEKSHLNRLHWLKNNYPIKEEQVCAYKTKLTFAPSIREIFEPLIQGASLYVFSEDDLSDANKFLLKVKAYNLSRIFFTPSHLAALLVSQDSASYLTCIKHLEISGESITSSLLNLLKKTLTSTKIYNRYGATEIASVVYLDLTEYESNYPSIPVGRPIQNTKVYVVNDKMQILPIGCVGEIVIGGDCCAIGYLKEVTNNNFVKNPLSPNLTSVNFFNTGDLGKIMPNGMLFQLGRKNRICKVRGFRINLEEIEHELSKIKLIKHSAVLHSSKNDTINAFVVLNNPKENNFQKKILSQLSKKLPYYSIPTNINLIDKMPKTNSGKIDYIGLNQYVVKNNIISFKHKNEQERIIMEFLKDIISYKNNTNETNFFRLGMTSLSTQTLAYKLSEYFMTNIPVSLIYSNPNIQSLALALNEICNKAHSNNFVVINQEARSNIFAFPPAGGSSYNYKKFGELLHGRQLIAFNKPPSNFGADTIEKLASHYIGLIKAHNFCEPYFLVGWSLGGTLAYEVACQLQRLGHQLSSLFLIDPGFNLKHFGINGKYESFSQKQIESIMHKNLKSTNLNSKILQEMMNNLYSDAELINKYTPKRYEGSVVLIKPNNVRINERNYGLANNGLEYLVVGKIHKYQVPGNHISMMADNVRYITEIFHRHYGNEVQ